MTSIAAKRTATSAPVVALVCVGIFMTTLDASIVNIGLPSIATAFGTALNGTVEWIVIGYLVVIGAANDVGRAALEATFLRAFHAALATCAGFAAIGALAALVRGRERRQSAGASPVPVTTNSPPVSSGLKAT